MLFAVIGLLEVGGCEYLVPVGGAVIAVFKQSAIKTIAQFYPGLWTGRVAGGRSSVMSLYFDLGAHERGQFGLIFDKTLVKGHWVSPRRENGRERALKTCETQTCGRWPLYHEQWLERHRAGLFKKMKRRLIAFAADIGECVYDVDDNQISLAVTLSSIPQEKQTLFGSILFNRGITGARAVVSTNDITTIEGCEFVNFGSHSNEQHGGYLNIACGVGMTEAELDELFNRMTAAYTKFTRKNGFFMAGDTYGRSTPDDVDEESDE
ncbi:putative O-phosphoseryl-tRNA(Sec) selenium transferase [Teladorsagia circumcincta]|uniref:Putative O-phosphoseryl-tRNA(Sec) selenium transferase n=1 Tax=Teladorsagia circumcincta TaxID=45464 RepID=A0A2G9UU87_TELCI|nr:putative O-phosphoseryl-tRNA(Sec) selenium transferase [Teladorsagia circumcincta]